MPGPGGRPGPPGPVREQLQAEVHENPPQAGVGGAPALAAAWTLAGAGVLVQLAFWMGAASGLTRPRALLR